MTLTFINVRFADCMDQLCVTDYNRIRKIHCLPFFPYKRHSDQIWPCRKIGQYQSRVIIFSNFDGV